ncbi:endonuclease [Thiothrix eikelboomii]|uniref:endonuclease n=1 Tax=Thiothrix eikelboomii TaxID=92487 RepID=UPI003BAE6C15
MPRYFALLCCLAIPSALAETTDYTGDLPDEDIASLEAPALTARSLDYSFSQSKWGLAQKVYKNHRLAFYSGCQFRAQQKLLAPDWKSCGYQARKNPERAKRIEWEHVVPAWVFGHQLKCWQQGGRAHCRDTNAQFRQMEADMHNLVPAIGELNGDRSNLPYGMVKGEPRAYGAKVNMEIDFKTRTAEPPDQVYGDIARINFYMRERYHFSLSSQQLQLFTAWNNLDPVDAWEQQRNELIRQAQGNDNPYVTHYQRLDTKNLEPVQRDWVDELYLIIFNQRANLPYFVFAFATLGYLVYLQYRRSRVKKQKTATSTATTTPTQRKKPRSTSKTDKPQ